MGRLIEKYHDIFDSIEKNDRAIERNLKKCINLIVKFYQIQTDIVKAILYEKIIKEK
jgi:hypothetical protein